MNHPTVASTLLGLALSTCACACSTSSPHAGPASMDAGVQDVAPDDTAAAATEDTASPPIPEGGFPHDDGGSKCDQLEAMVAMLQATAQACVPNSSQAQCTGHAQGTCCPVAVDVGANPGDIDGFEVAVTNYVMMCKPKCSLPNCPPPGQCVGAGTVGTCQ